MCVKNTKIGNRTIKADYLNDIGTILFFPLELLFNAAKYLKCYPKIYEDTIICIRMFDIRLEYYDYLFSYFNYIKEICIDMTLIDDNFDALHMNFYKSAFNRSYLDRSYTVYAPKYLANIILLDRILIDFNGISVSEISHDYIKLLKEACSLYSLNLEEYITNDIIDNIELFTKVTKIFNHRFL